MSFANPSALMATENASIFTPNHRFRLKKTATSYQWSDYILAEAETEMAGAALKSTSFKTWV